MTDSIFDATSDSTSLNDQQLVQLETGAIQSSKSKKLSADAFDSGDGSSHLDQDYDSDVAAMQKPAPQDPQPSEQEETTEAEEYPATVLTQGKKQ